MGNYLTNTQQQEQTQNDQAQVNTSVFYCRIEENRVEFSFVQCSVVSVYLFISMKELNIKIGTDRDICIQLQILLIYNLIEIASFFAALSKLYCIVYLYIYMNQSIYFSIHFHQ